MSNTKISYLTLSQEDLINAGAFDLQMAIKALPDAVLIQHGNNFRTGVSFVSWWIMKKHDFFTVSCCLQGCLQPNQFPPENLFIMAAALFLFKKPTTGAADRIIFIEIAIVI